MADRKPATEATHVRVTIEVGRTGRLVWIPESEWTFYVKDVGALVLAVRDIVRSANAFGDVNPETTIDWCDYVMLDGTRCQLPRRHKGRHMK